MNWHQQSAARRLWRHRNKAAHILSTESVGTTNTLCGSYPTVHVSRRHVDNPANKVCKRCLAKLRKESE